MGFEQKSGILLFVFRKSLSLQFCEQTKVRRYSSLSRRKELIMAWASIQKRERGRLSPGDSSEGGGEVLDSAYILKVKPTGLVKDWKMFSVRNLIVSWV
jgi:hypothetical protein